MVLAAVFVASGATCNRPLVSNPFAAPGPVAPQVLPAGASREQIVAAVNQNSARVQSLSVMGATITIPDMLGLPILSGNIAAERPGRFRLTAGTALSGQELDIGSNDELFWLWSRREQPPALYFCRHDRFATSNIRQVMPIEPQWLLAALGIVDIDPATLINGPLPHRDGKIELHTWLPSASGTLRRIMVIDAGRAWVTEQYVYDASNALVASAVAESFHYYWPEQVSLPEKLSINLPTAGLSFKIDLGSRIVINRLPGDPQQLWSLPTIHGVPQYDLSGAVPGTPLPGRAAEQPMGPFAPPAYGAPSAPAGELRTSF
jgi:hypothetical protein